VVSVFEIDFVVVIEFVSVHVHSILLFALNFAPIIPIPNLVSHAKPIPTFVLFVREIVMLSEIVLVKELV